MYFLAVVQKMTTLCKHFDLDKMNGTNNDLYLSIIVVIENCKKCLQPLVGNVKYFNISKFSNINTNTNML